jgi:DNA invertase Pin-like site-specific DNA recombinase
VRELERIAEAKAAGVYKGRLRQSTPPRTRIKGEGFCDYDLVGWPSEIAKTLKIGRASVYRVLA